MYVCGGVCVYICVCLNGLYRYLYHTLLSSRIPEGFLLLLFIAQLVTLCRAASSTYISGTVHLHGRPFTAAAGQ